MYRTTFQNRLRTAARHAVLFARKFVRQRLPDDVAFRVYANQSFDGHPRVGDEVVFPIDTLPQGEFHGPWSVQETVDFLWRDGRVPEWIDAAVEAIDGRRSLVSLLCCGRFTASAKLLYYQSGGLPPFGIKSPTLPPGWESVEVSGRFDLQWRDRAESATTPEVAHG
jgi:hypothetical protein